MTESRRRTLYYALLGTASVFYAWGLIALWFAHEWNIPEGRFFFVGILPVVTGVLLMVGALQVRAGLIEDEGDEGVKGDEEPHQEAQQAP